MTAKEVLAELKKLGTEQNRKIYPRHGTPPDKTIGVSFANIGAIVKKIKRDDALARELFSSGMFEANIVAAQIADPAAASVADMEAWADGCACYMDADKVGASVVARSPQGKKLALAWIKDKSGKRQRAGWAAIGESLKTGAQDFSDAEVLKLLAAIEKGIHKAENRTREVMLWVLIGIGTYRPSIRAEAIAAAQRIGPVDIDHGETGCKTPEAVSYIQKTAARQKGKA